RTTCSNTPFRCRLPTSRTSDPVHPPRLQGATGEAQEFPAPGLRVSEKIGTMMLANRNGFHFGLEAEFLLVDAASFRPLWYHDLKFETLNAALEAIPVDDFRCDDFKIEPPHRKAHPYVVEGYHLPDPDMNPIDLLPKGVEIRT